MIKLPHLELTPIYSHFCKSYLLIFLPLFLFQFSSCNVYNTIRKDTSNEASLIALHGINNTVVIHDNKEKQEYLLSNFNVSNGILQGTIKPSPKGKTHKHHTKHFNANKVNTYNPLAVMHIYTKMNDIKPGPIVIPIESIRFAETHESNPGKTIGRTIGIVLLGTVGFISLIGIGLMAF